MIPTISIITPVKNGMKFFDNCLKSILFQEGQFNIQYVVVDGMSEDGTYQLALNYANQIQDNQLDKACNQINMFIIREKDESMYDALVKGLRMCNGDVVAYLNADDYYLPGAFQRVLEIFAEYSECNWITGKPLSVNELGEKLYSKLPFSYHKRFIQTGYYGRMLPFIQQENIFFRSALLGEIDMTRLANFKLAGDYFIWKSLSYKNDLYIYSETFSAARMHSNRLSSDLKSYMIEFAEIADKPSKFIQILAMAHKMLLFLPEFVKKHGSKHINA